jgi:putative tricarboxylic transport membrane protein
LNLFDKALPVAVALFSFGYIWLAFEIPTAPIGDPLGPRAFPILLGVALVLAAILLAIENHKMPKKEWEVLFSRRTLRVNGGIFLLSVVYIIIFEPLGYIPATILYLLCLTNCLNRGRLFLNLVVSVGFALCSYGVFAKLLGASLPHGIMPL